MLKERINAQAETIRARDAENERQRKLLLGQAATLEHKDADFEQQREEYLQGRDGRDAEIERLEGRVARRDVTIHEQDAEIARLNGLRREQAETIRRHEAEIERLRALFAGAAGEAWGPDQEQQSRGSGGGSRGAGRGDRQRSASPRGHGGRWDGEYRDRRN